MPVQINLLPVAEVHYEHAHKLKELFASKGFRVEVDDQNEKIGYRLRLSSLNKIPYTLVIGDKEVENKSVTYRIFSHQEQINVSKEEFINLILDEIKNKLLRK